MPTIQVNLDNDIDLEFELEFGRPDPDVYVPPWEVRDITLIVDGKEFHNSYLSDLIMNDILKGGKHSIANKIEDAIKEHREDLEVERYED